MPNLGEEYEEIVAAVERALDRAADVRVGQWIEGPDGGREVDVEVRGIRDGAPYFVLVECKDWKRPVNIGEMDKLNDKGHDLGADRIVLYSNSGFTAKALRKATRVGIGCASALMSGNRRIRAVVEREFVAKRLSVDQWSLEIVVREEDADRISTYHDPRQLWFAEDPVFNWCHKASLDLLRECEGYDTGARGVRISTTDGVHGGDGGTVAAERVAPSIELQPTLVRPARHRRRHDRALRLHQSKTDRPRSGDVHDRHLHA